MATKKEFVLNVVEELKANPRAVLAGHGINSAVLQTIIERPDVLSKLANVLYSMKTAKQGAKGLKKAPNFRIFGYKSFGLLADNGRDDVETFIGGLPEGDSVAFTNSNNIMVIMLAPQQKITEGEETSDSIITGKSTCLTFDKAVDKNYGTPGAMFVAVMIGDSAVRTSEEAVATRTVKVNQKKQAKRTPGMVKAELKAKANKKLEILNGKRAELQQTAYNTKMQLQQFKSLGKQLGVKSPVPTFVVGGINKANASAAEANAKIAALDPESKALFNQAVKAAKAGKNGIVRAILKELGNDPILVEAVKNGGKIGGGAEIVDARAKGLKDEIKRLMGRSEALIASLDVEADPKKKLSIRSMISKNSAKIKELRAKLGTYKNISVSGMNKKATLLKQVSASIEANLAAGEKISQSLANALAEIDATPAQKQIIKEQIIQQVSNGMPTQFAVQQALQDNFSDEINTLGGNTALSSGKSIEDILAGVI